MNNMMLPIFGGGSSGGALDGKVSYIRCVTAESKFFGQSVKATNVNGEVKAVGIFSDEGIAVLAVGKSGVYTVTAESASNENQAGQVAETTVDVTEWYKVYDVILGSNTSILKVEVYLTNLSDKHAQNTVYKLTGTDSTTGLEKTDTGKLQNEGQTTIYSTITGTCKFEVVTQNGTGAERVLDDALSLSTGTVTEKNYRIAQNITAISKTDKETMRSVVRLLNSGDISTSDLPWAVGDEVDTCDIVESNGTYTAYNRKWVKSDDKNAHIVASKIKFRIVHILTPEERDMFSPKGLECYDRMYVFNNSNNTIKSTDYIGDSLSAHYVIGTTEKILVTPGNNYENHLSSHLTLYGPVTNNDGSVEIRSTNQTMKKIMELIPEERIYYWHPSYCGAKGALSVRQPNGYSIADAANQGNLDHKYYGLFDNNIGNSNFQYYKRSNDAVDKRPIVTYNGGTANMLYALFYNAYEVYGDQLFSDYNTDKRTKEQYKPEQWNMGNYFGEPQFDYFKNNANRIFTKDGSAVLEDTYTPGDYSDSGYCPGVKDIDKPTAKLNPVSTNSTIHIRKNANFVGIFFAI